MGFLGFDLVYELQVELGWEKEFATAARKEYLRYLELRAKAQDHRACKLTPSRVIAIVWNLHRQWTVDYENTCAALGGYIHHYPPAMRLGLPSEQTYANTVEMYKTHFNENPPDAYWGLPICSTKPSSSNVDYLSPLKVADRTDALIQPGTKLKRRSQAVGSSRVLAPAMARTIDATNPTASVAMGHTKSEPKSPTSKRTSGTIRVRQGYVLRPMPPGEKRKRGRPSMSEYIPAAQATSQLQDYVGNATPLEGPIKPATSGAVSVPGRGSAAMLKSRRQQGKPLDAKDVNVNGRTASDVPAAAAMFKRPRGRPRKDGSWPVPRTRPGPVMKQKIEPITSADAQMSTESDQPPTSAQPIAVQDSTDQTPKGTSGDEAGKGEEMAQRVATGSGDNEMIDVSENAQKKELVSTPQSSPTHLVPQATMPAAAPQPMETDKGPTAV